MSNTRRNMAYIDANVFVYAIVSDDEDKKLKCREVLHNIVSGKIQASTSVLTWDELVWVLKKCLTNNEYLDKGRIFLETPNLTILQADRKTMFKAQELMSVYSIRPRDAIHAATALLNKEPEIITDNLDFDKIKEIKRIAIEDFKT